jgi:hypothetical protein
VSELNPTPFIPTPFETAPARINVVPLCEDQLRWRGYEQWLVTAPDAVPWSDLAALCNALGWSREGAHEIGLPVECLLNCAACGAVFDIETRREYTSAKFCSRCVRSLEEERAFNDYLRQCEKVREYSREYKKRHTPRRSASEKLNVKMRKVKIGAGA